MNKYLVSIAAGADALVAATGANAATNLTVGSAYSSAPSGTVYVGWNDYDASFGPQTISGTFNGSLINATAFCIELTQNSYLGSTSFEVTPLNSYLSDLGKSGSYNSIAKLLSTYGDVGTKTNDVALQLAIWELRYDNGASVKSGNFQVDWNTQSTYTNAANNQLANLGTVDSSLQFWVAKAGDKQDLLFVTQAPAVPEPATWAMMIIGFAAIGHSMRARRNSTAVSFA